jgi:SWI/SNF-related matrix-associated actin-dependent regulator of chromatin subfamily A-like protein 1
MTAESLLLPHQAAGAEWLATRKTALLGDEPRVGKTRTLLEAARLIGAERPVVICPAIVRTHWLREAELLGTAKPWVWSYDELVYRGEAEREKILRGLRPDALILDEAHYLKSPTSKRAKLILGKSGYARRVPHVWAATGTPMPKHPGELWNLLVSLFPQAVTSRGFTTREQFEEHFCIRVKRQAGRGSYWKVLGMRNGGELKEILGEVMMRRTFAEISKEAPQMAWQQLILERPGVPKATDELTQAVEAAMAEGRLALLEHDPELARMRRKLGEFKAPVAAQHICEMLEEEHATKVAVFAHHHSVLDELEKAFQPHGVVRIDGTTSHGKRVSLIDKFQTSDDVRVFLGQNVACMTGITLDAAEVAFLVEPDWTAVVNLQVGNRIMNVRDGKARSVQIVSLAGTLDEGIGRLNRREVLMQQEVL